MSLEVIAAIISILGAFWVASATRDWRLLGFWCFATANILLIIVLWDHRALVIMQCAFFISSARGIYNNRYT